MGRSLGILGEGEEKGGKQAGQPVLSVTFSGNTLIKEVTLNRCMQRCTPNIGK